MKVDLSLETSESQANLMCGTVNKVHHESRKWVKNCNSTNSSSREKKCFACGRYGHIKTDKECPAKGKKCRKCKEGHFEKCCKSKPPKFSKSKPKTDKVRNVGNSDTEDSFVFTVTNQNSVSGDIKVSIVGIDTAVIIDSGASCNVIDRELGTIKENED